MIRNWETILQRTGEHLSLVAWAVGLALLIGVPLGILITRQKSLEAPVLTFANIVQTVPSLAFFGFLIPVTGIGWTTAVVVLFFYSLLPIIRNTYTGIKGVDPALVEAGRGMGLTNLQILYMVELPLALPVMVVGVRVSTVIAIGTATVAALVGGGGLGAIILRGLSRANDAQVLAGAIPAALLAVVADLGLTWAERRLTPAGLRPLEGRSDRQGFWSRLRRQTARGEARPDGAGVTTRLDG
ncbi:MAG: ABC transporter permease [Bacillota bacterium]